MFIALITYPLPLITYHLTLITYQVGKGSNISQILAWPYGLKKEDILPGKQIFIKKMMDSAKKKVKNNWYKLSKGNRTIQTSAMGGKKVSVLTHSFWLA